MSASPIHQHEQYVFQSHGTAHCSSSQVVANPPVEGIESSSDSPLQIWISGDDNNFTSRLASRSSFPSAVDEDRVGLNLLSMPGGAFSLHTSIFAHDGSAIEDDSDSVDSDMVPSLTRAYSTASSSSSLSSAPGTDVVSVIDGGHTLESHDGILLRRPERHQADADLLCPFEVLDCCDRFASIIEFKCHVFYHFRGHPLPDYAPCFFCREPFFRRPDEDPSMPWNEMLTHMVHTHFRGGQEVGTLKPDIALMRYMWNRRIISEPEFKRCQLIAEPTRMIGARRESHNAGEIPAEAPMAPPATPPSSVQAHLNQSVGPQSEAYVVMASQRSERRQRDISRLTARVRGHL